MTQILLNHQDRQWLMDKGFKRHNKGVFPHFTLRFSENNLLTVKITGAVLINGDEIFRTGDILKIRDLLVALRVCLCTNTYKCLACKEKADASTTKKKTRTKKSTQKESPSETVYDANYPY